MTEPLRLILIASSHARAGAERVVMSELAPCDIVHLEHPAALLAALEERATDAVVLATPQLDDEATRALGAVRTRWLGLPVVALGAGDAVPSGLVDILEAEALGEGLRTLCGRASRMSGRGVEEHSLRLLLDALRVGTFRSSVEGQLLHASPALLNIVGLNPDQATIPLDITPHYLRVDDRRQLVNELRRDGVVHEHQLELRRPDGRCIWVAVTERLTTTAAGRPVIDGIMADITMQKRAEDALKHTEERNRLLFECASDAILLADADSGLILDANPQAERLLGRPRESLVGTHQETLHPTGNGIDYAQIFREHAEATTTVSGPLKVRRADGTTVPVEISAGVVELGESRVVQGIFRDVTERERAEHALKESEERFRRLAEATPDGIMIHEVGRILDCNERLGEMVGCDSSELVGTNALDLVIPQHRGIVSTNIATETPGPYEVLARRKDGTTLLVEIRATEVPYANSRARVACIRDLTRERRTEESLRESERALATLFSNLPGMAYRCCNDADWTMEFVSEGAVELTGYLPADVIDNRSISFGRIMHPDDRERVWNEVQLAIERREAFSLNYRIITKSEEVRWVWERGRGVFDEDGDLVALEGFVSDVTELKNTEEALRRSESIYRTIFENTGSATVIIDDRAVITLANGEFSRLSGFAVNEVEEKKRWTDFVVPEDHERLMQFQRLVMSSMRPAPESFEFGFRNRFGERRTIYATVATIPGTRLSVASLVDITDRKRAEEQLLFDAFHDGLTGLPNRELFLDRLAGALARSRRRDDYEFAVLFLDLDRFKLVNESLGHLIGDRLLEEVSRRLASSMRRGDTVARLGGDEFAILLDDLNDVDDVTFLVDRLHSRVSEPYHLDGHEVYTSASIGIALSASGYEHAEEVLRDADIAMYRAKARGKSQSAVFDVEMHARAVALLELETDLRRALERGDFRLHYQPIVALKSGRTAGLEALIRWEHPTRGVVYPEEFIHVAEESGLIVPIGQWVLLEACRQMRQWRDVLQSNSRPVAISVNLSARQFTRPELVDDVAQVLERTGLDGSSLVLEITESVLMEHAEIAVEVLSRLRQLGVKVHLDDFGMGYSSLSYLNSFPIDSLKIDRSFVSRLGLRGEGLEIVRAIITLARSLGMEAIAEGVETEEQRAQLHALECLYAQGYLFHSPLPADEMGRLLGADHRW